MSRPTATPRILRLAFVAALGFPVVAYGQGDAPPDDAPPGGSPSPDDGPPEDDSGKPKAPPKAKETAAQCVKHTTQSRFVSGYDHLVHIDNTCSVSVSCKVSTDVSPAVQSVTVKTKEQKTVLTYRGSPVRDFKVSLVCELSK